MVSLVCKFASWTGVLPTRNLLVAEYGGGNPAGHLIESGGGDEHLTEACRGTNFSIVYFLCHKPKAPNNLRCVGDDRIVRCGGRCKGCIICIRLEPNR